MRRKRMLFGESPVNLYSNFDRFIFSPLKFIAFFFLSLKRRHSNAPDSLINETWTGTEQASNARNAIKYINFKWKTAGKLLTALLLRKLTIHHGYLVFICSNAVIVLDVATKGVVAEFRHTISNPEDRSLFMASDICSRFDFICSSHRI